MCHKQEKYSEKQHGNYAIWVVRDMIDVRVHKSIKHGSENAKQQSDFAHQNATEAVLATISKKNKQIIM